MNLRKLITVITVWMTVLTMNAQNVREAHPTGRGVEVRFRQRR